MMREERFNLVFYGDIAPGKTPEQVKNVLATQFHIGSHQLEEWFTHTPFLLKRTVNYRTALTYQILLERAGVLCRIEAVSESSLRMPLEYCNVVFHGDLCEGYQLDDVKCNLLAFLHLTKKRINDLFVGHPVMLMQDVDSRLALKMQISFELAGALCRLEPVKHDRLSGIATNALTEAQTVPVAVEQILCPKCGFQQPQSRKCRYCGIYMESYFKKRPVYKERRLKQLARQTDAAMKQELLYWGIGFSVFGALQVIGLGVWGMGFVGIGLLNLLFRRRSGLLAGRGMFLMNGLTLCGSGVWSLVTMLSNSISLPGDIGIRFGIGHVESGMLAGGFLLWSVLQIGLGIYGLGRFKQYTSTQQSLSKKMRRMASKSIA